LPWNRLTYLALTPTFMELTDSFKVLSLCTNLCECYLCLCPDSKPPTVVPPAIIQLPHLRKLGLKMSRESSYADYFRPLMIPKLEEFAFVLSDPSADHLKDLRETIDRLSIPDLGLVLYYDGDGGDDILRTAHSLPPLTSIKVYQYFLRASTMELIAQDAFFQTLTSLEACIRCSERRIWLICSGYIGRVLDNQTMRIRAYTLRRSRLLGSVTKKSPNFRGTSH